MIGKPLATTLGLVVTSMILTSCASHKIAETKDSEPNTQQAAATTTPSQVTHAAKRQGSNNNLAKKLAHNAKRKKEIELVKLKQQRHNEWKQRQQAYHSRWQSDQLKKQQQAKAKRTVKLYQPKPQLARYQPAQRRPIRKAAMRSNAQYQRRQSPPQHTQRYQSANANFAQRLSNAALNRTRFNVRYDGRYEKLSYPWGDVPQSIGVCTDVVIRSYRQLGIDLQQDVHEDMKNNFFAYPNLTKWNLSAPDANIDHRRVYNLQAFFKRHGVSLPITNNPRHYKPGDLVTWNLFPGQEHIGVVVNKRSPSDPNRYMIVHNISEGPKLEDVLFRFRITGHYRYYGMR